MGYLFMVFVITAQEVVMGAEHLDHDRRDGFVYLRVLVYQARGQLGF